MKFLIYRYNPQKDSKPRMQTYELDLEACNAVMVLDALMAIKEQDESLSFRRSCKEGVCGSSGMNINGQNTLACITPLASLKAPIVIKPFPGMPVIRDLIVDMTQFNENYKKAQPCLQNSEPPPPRERLQSPKEREKLDGLYECILCGCCSSACFTYWWNSSKFLGPAALLQACRFILDSRDDQTRSRLKVLTDAYSVFRCRGIMNCAAVCPKGLNPAKAIAAIHAKMLSEDV